MRLRFSHAIAALASTVALASTISIGVNAAPISNLNADINTAIDRGLAWLDGSGYNNYGSAGDATGLVLLTLLEKRLGTTAQGYSGASAADQARMDNLFSYLFDTRNNDFY